MKELLQGLMTESWIQTISIIGTTLGTFYYFHRDFKNEMDEQTKRTDLLNQNFQESMMAQTRRTDRLYEMFVDLIKEGKK